MDPADTPGVPDDIPPGHGGHLWARHPAVRTGDRLTFGERSADVMRNAFGSWAFVGAFLTFMAVWMVANTVFLGSSAWDKYPYILLNLALSMMAGLQGALILIAAKRADRVSAEQATAHYKETVTLDANTAKLVEINAEVLALQHQQLDVLTRLDEADARERTHQVLLEAILATVDPGALAKITKLPGK